MSETSIDTAWAGRPGAPRGARRRRRTLAIVVAAALLVAACGDDDGDSADEPTVTTGAAATSTSAAATTTTAPPDECTAARKGGQLDMSVLVETRGLDPVVSLGGGTSGGTELGAIYDTLMRWDPETATYEPWVAKSFEPNADYSEWTLTLRDGVKFGNGDPLTTAEVKTSIARHADPANAAVSIREVSQIKEMRIVDPKTMVFVLASPWGTFPYVLSDMAGMIINPKVLEAMGKEAFNKNPVGAGVGPYEVQRFAPGEELVMKAKTDYWGGPVCIDTLRFIDIPTDAATKDALAKGEIDVAYFRSPAPNKEAKDTYGDNTFVDPTFLGSLLMMNNVAGRPTANAKVRKAVAMAVDPAAYDQRVNSGVGLPGSAIVPKGYSISPGLDGPPYDQAGARALVAEAKAAGWDGKIGLVSSAAQPDAGIAIEAMLEAVGMDVNLEQLPAPEASRRVFVERNFDLNMSAAGVSTASPVVRLQRFFSTGNTFTGFGSPEFDAGLTALRAAGDVEEIKAAMGTLQKVWNEQVPSHSVSVTENVVAWDEGVHGLLFNVNTTIIFTKAYVEG